MARYEPSPKKFFPDKTRILLSKADDFIERRYHLMKNINIDHLADIIYAGGYDGHSYKEDIEILRSTNIESVQKRIKKHLPFIVLTCKFDSTNRHQRENIQYLTNYIFLDIDGKDNKKYTLNDIRNKTYQLPYVKAAWVSSSGKGVHLVIKYKTDSKFHRLNNFEEIWQQVKKQFNKDCPGLVIDKKCKDPNRRVKLSYDKEVLYRSRCKVFNIEKPKEESIIYSIYKGKHGNSVRYDETLSNKEFMTDYDSLSILEFISKYKDQYQIINRKPYSSSEIKQMSPASPIIVFDYDHIEVNRNFKYVQTDRARKVIRETTEGYRNMTMLQILTFQRLAKPEATFEELLFNACFNKTLGIKHYWKDAKEELLKIAKHVYQLPESKLYDIFQKNKHKQPLARYNNNFTGERKSSTKTGEVAINKKIRRIELVKSLCPDGNLTDDKLNEINSKLLLANLIKKSLSRKTIYEYLSSCGLGRRQLHRREMENKIRNINYNDSQSNNAKKLGISDRTIRRYCKKSGTLYSEIKNTSKKLLINNTLETNKQTFYYEQSSRYERSDLQNEQEAKTFVYPKSVERQNSYG